MKVGPNGWTARWLRSTGTRAARSPPVTFVAVDKSQSGNGDAERFRAKLTEARAIVAAYVAEVEPGERFDALVRLASGETP